MRGGRARTVAAAVVTLVAAGLTVGLAGAASGTTFESLWPDTATPRKITSLDTRSVELGVRFKAVTSGRVVGIQFYKGPDNTGTHTGTLWNLRGERLATVTFTDETESGWQQALFDQPVQISANTTYVASYHAPNGRYSRDMGYFWRPHQSGNLLAPRSSWFAFNGVRGYGPGMPKLGDWWASNFWVTPLFTTDSEPPPTTTEPTTTTTEPTTTTTTGGGGPDLPRVPWEGGPEYYAQFSAAAAWTDPNFFPVGVWFESVLQQSDVDLDRGAGINTYVELTDNSDLNLVRANGMYAMTSGPRPGTGAETVSWLLTDEADMWGGPGSDVWTGRFPSQGTVCDPPEPQGKCGYTVMQTMRDRMPQGDGRFLYANYGKGVTFWETDEQAGRFVNEFTDATSADTYWYTDPWVCPLPGETDRYGTTLETCRLAASYGLIMNRVRDLDAVDGRRQPVYAFIEDGHPFTENDAPTIDGDKITGAVMSSLIHEARGIIYFNHNFGGPCLSHHVLRDPCGADIRGPVTRVNEQIRQLAPVLNTQSFQYTFNPSLDTMLKAHDGSFYIFTMLGRGTPTGSHTLTLPPGLDAATAEVLFENRSLSLTDGQLTDTFAAEHTYHVYKITP
ncbi:MAG TPA: DUF4082 domain-containing protein [Actinophytocola sp.]|uniref:DUF4082 domain-containing protein n=1 Tax=Actinophytocola sp. TaxID=1872138 RepID=UPI002DDD93D1|nr:DUF4082 domain-containing protein [Actinophytocola sp.]HEV2780964.1 DUF4082 domain-containing protein [Actinophytocola sp.]